MARVSPMELTLAYFTVWVASCSVVFVYYYSCPSHRVEPNMANQLRCMSGIILCNRPFISALMCGAAGGMLLAVGLHIEDSPAAMLALFCFYAGFVFMVQYDVREHHVFHFSALLVLMASAVVLVALLPLPMLLASLFYGVSALLGAVMLVNFALLEWKPPYLTVQAVVELMWVVTGLVCVFWFLT